MKNNIDDMDNYIKELSNRIVVPKDIFQESYNKIINQKNKKINIFKYVACFLLIFFTITGITVYTSKLNKNQENNTQIAEDTTENNINQKNKVYSSAPELPVASYSISLSNKNNVPQKFISPMGLDIIKKDSDCIAVVKLNKILYYTNYSKKVNLYSQIPLTVSDVTIEKVFKGDLSNSFEMLSIGGILSIKDFEKSCQPEQIKKHGFDKMDDLEKETTYVEIKNTISEKLPKLRSNKYYLVYLKYNSNFEKYQVIDQFMYNYDITNNTIENTDTNEWLKFIYN